MQQPRFLPTTRDELRALGWDELDVLLVSGDAYVDHPAFGVALLGRWLVAHGVRVGIVAQPRWDRPDDVARLGRPRLLCGVTAGALDSMLAHYTAFRQKRRQDAYTPGGRVGARPNRACIVYANLVRQAFPGLPVVLGGLEASMRRVSHYDFWSDSLRRSLVLDAKADLLLYGMAERSLLRLCQALLALPAQAVAGEEARRAVHGVGLQLPGCALPAGAGEQAPGLSAQLPSHEQILADPARLVRATLMLEAQAHRSEPQWLSQRVAERVVLVAPPAEPLTTAELDALYDLPFSRRAHPAHAAPIPAEEMIRFSLTSHRGCGGGCSFCSLALHQGRRVSSRSAGSLRAEAARLTRHPQFKGSLSDVGGPTANLWGSRCAREGQGCHRPSCVVPVRCEHLQLADEALAAMLRGVAQVEGVEHLRVASGVRHDLAQDQPAYLRLLVRSLTGGQLKVAPEHNADPVLRLMRKPPFSTFERFLAAFAQQSARAKKEQYLVPYLMSAFPGSTLAQTHALGRWFRQRGWRPRQVQCFVPTPGTLATAMFHAGQDLTGERIPVARTDRERRAQHRALTGEGGGE